MSNPTASQTAQPASGWYPPLNNLGLPRALTNSIQQVFSLVYSLRDTQNQNQARVVRYIQYGSKQDRTQVNPQSAESVMEGGLWFETDTGDIYQSRFPTTGDSTTRTWVLVAHGVAAP